jgi:hypothetical protein
MESEVEVEGEAEMWMSSSMRIGGCIIADEQRKDHFESRDLWGYGMDAPVMYTADMVGWDISLVVMGYFGSHYSEFYVGPRLEALRWTFSLGIVKRERWIRRRRRRRVTKMTKNLEGITPSELQ